MTSAPPDSPDRPPGPITVVVAHRRDDRREQLARWLHVDGRFQVVAEAADAATAAGRIEADVPDVAFVDVDLVAGEGETAIIDGVAAIAAAHRSRPAVRLVAVADEDDDRAYAALAAGAIGLYVWDQPVAPATDVAAGVVRGEAPLTAGWAGRILDEVRWLSREPGLLPAPKLSPTELEVLRRVSTGVTPAAIAEMHGVTVHLVGLHAAIAVTKVWRHHDDLQQLELLRQG